MAKLERHMFCGSDLEMRKEINEKGELCGNQESPMSRSCGCGSQSSSTSYL